MYLTIVNVLSSTTLRLNVGPLCSVGDIITQCFKMYITGGKSRLLNKGYILHNNTKHYDDVVMSSTSIKDDDIIILYAQPSTSLKSALDSIGRINSKDNNTIMLNPRNTTAAYCVRYFKDEIVNMDAHLISTFDIPEVFDDIKDIITLTPPDISFITSRMSDWFASNCGNIFKINAVIGWVIDALHVLPISYQSITIILSIKEPYRSKILSVYLQIGRYCSGFTQGDLINIVRELDLSYDAKNAIHDFPPRPIDILILACINIDDDASSDDLYDILDKYIHGRCVDINNMISYDKIVDSLGYNYDYVADSLNLR
jgi:hypothetical protein